MLFRSSKQLKCETDAQFVGYGSMLTEGFLAVLVILACVAGLGLGIPELVDGEKTGAMLTGADAYSARYGTWAGSAGLGPKVGAFVDGAANFIKALGIPASFAVSLMGVFVASFAATTLDTACRLQRYVTQELGRVIKVKPLTNKHGATIFAIVIAGVIAALPAAAPETGFFATLSCGGLAGASEWLNTYSGKGGLLLWPLFGATNQLLGGLAFLVILFWMHRRNIPNWFVLIPATFMLILPAAAMILQLFVGPKAWLTGDSPNYLLSAFGLAAIALEIWILFEAFAAWPKARGVLEESADEAAESLPDGGRSC